MNSNGIQVRLGDLLQVMWKRRFLIIAFTAAGLIFGLLLSGISALQGEMGTGQTITASAAVVTKTTSGAFSSGLSNPNKDDVYLAQDMVDTVIFTMKSSKVMKTVIDRQSLVGVTVKDIADNLTVEQYNDTQMIEFTLSWRDAEEGKEVLLALVDATEGILQQTLRIGQIEMIDAPAADSGNLGAKIGASSWMILCMFGFIAGAGLSALEIFIHPTLMNLKDVENFFGLEKLAVVPRINSLSRNRVSLLSDQSEVAAELRKYYAAAAHIVYNRVGKKNRCKCLYVTSAVPGEGKTMAAANLALQLADMEHKVLLIDLDSKNPHLGSMFLEKVNYNHSLNALYRGEATVEEAITTLTGYLDLMPAVLEHNSFTVDNAVFDMIHNLMDHYEFIIIDTTSIEESPQVLSLNKAADLAVFVMRYDYASMQSIQNALTTMDKSGIRVLGCIVNDARYINGAQTFNRFQREEPKTRSSLFSEEDFFDLSSESEDNYQSIMDEGFEEELEDDTAISDDEALQSLIEMGIEGNWEEEDDE